MAAFIPTIDADSNAAEQGITTAYMSAIRSGNFELRCDNPGHEPWVVMNDGAPHSFSPYDREYARTVARLHDEAYAAGKHI
jgi:hypothetical protein